MNKYILALVVVIALLINSNSVFGQNILKSGFDPDEYKMVLEINSHHFDTILGKYTLPEPSAKLIFRSKEVGFDNRWDYWKTDSNIGVISLRGTAPTKTSWLENFYAAMIPATGSVITSDSTVFAYKLAKDSNAYIHVGWLVGLSFIADDINELIHSEYDKGVTNFIIVGHSQGGVMSMMLRSYLEYVDDNLGRRILIKTYASAPPKPGNLYYAYDFEEITQGGWAYRIVNTADWVPQMPFSVQRFDDLNEVNPFSNYKKLIKNSPWYERMYINGKMNKMDKRSTKTQETYTELLGEKSFAYVQKVLPDAKNPSPMASFDYKVCGNAIILRPTETYNTNYVDKAKKEGIFVHHHFYAYWLLVKMHFPDRG